MLFNSFEYILFFLPLLVIVYFWLGKKRNKDLANLWLVFASLFFYSWWNVIYLPLLLASICFNYYVSGFILRFTERRLIKKSIFIMSIFLNVALLCYFKYMDFFIENINKLGFVHFNLLHIVLPLGISFFTITQMVYLVDCYQGIVKSRNLLHYSLFVSFFPHLLAGPILYHKPMMSQFSDPVTKTVNWDNLASGMTLFVIGLGKKVLIADEFLNIANPGFNHPYEISMLESWVASVAYMLQLYFDFSGYSDMAVGAARMLNINIPINFNSPYKCKNIIDLWSRWHISLTNTITNYLYTPIVLAFKKPTFTCAMIATFLAMFIAGIWHGAGWNFVIFGSMHGIGLVINHIWKRYKLPMKLWLGRLITLYWVMLTLVFLRARSADDAINMILTMFNLTDQTDEKNLFLNEIYRSMTKLEVLLQPNGHPGLIQQMIVFFVVAILITQMLPNSNEIVKKLVYSKKSVAAVCILILCCMYHLGSYTEFLYFQF